MEDYLPRLFDKTLEKGLKSKGCVMVVGPKGCGKSTTSRKFAKTVIDLLPRSTRAQYVSLAKNAPHQFLNLGPKPILIDEWQIVSFIWDSIKVEVDEAQDFGLYILTGSVTDTLSNDELSGEENEKHTGNLRIIKKRMRTFSLYESKDGNGSVSLDGLKKGIFTASLCNLTIEDYAFLLCRGGWPISLGRERKVALQQAKDFYEVTVTEDIFSLKSVKLDYDEYKARRLMRSYARNVATECPDKTLIQDVSQNEKHLMRELLANTWRPYEGCM